MRITPAPAAAHDAALPAKAADQAILDAFAARCREFAENYERDLVPDEEDGYFRRLDAYEAVIRDTPATTVAGIVAKLRITFHQQHDADWVDNALIGPAHPAFVTGLAAAEPRVRFAWSIIENLALIGGVDLAAQAAGEVRS